MFQILDSVVLGHDGGPSPGVIAGMAVAADGSLFVADVLWGSILEYASNGSHVDQYGGFRSESPIPTGQLAGLAVVGESVLLFDSQSSQISEYRRGEGIPTRQVALPGPPSMMMSSAGGSLMFGVHAGDRRGGLYAWSQESEPMRVADLPSVFDRHAHLSRFHSIPIVQWEDTIAVGFSPLEEVLVGNRGKPAFDTLVVPFSARRGLQPHVLLDLNASRADLINSSSFLVGMGRLSTGELVLVHYDSHFTTPGAVPTELYVSLVTADRRAACVDGALPRDYSTQPHVTFQGDTLLVFDRRVDSDNSASSVISRWVIDTTQCDWIALGEPNRMGLLR
jgi:hypothetical protein